MKRTAKAVWKGKSTEGKGTLSTQSQALSEHPYSFITRFEDETGKTGTNPEELIAAAHAGCFAMAFSLMLAEQNYKSDELDVSANVSIEKQGEGFAITNSHLEVQAKIPDIDDKTFQKIANQAKDGCPVSQVLNCNKTLDAKLV